VGRSVDSSALTLLNKILRIAGTGFGASQTELDDGNLTQVLEVSPVIRRSLTPANSSGIFYSIFANVHAGAGQLHTSVNPYTTPVGTLGAFVTPLRTDQEIWLISAAIARTAGAGTLDAALLELELPAISQAFGENNSGVAVASSKDYPLGRWDVIDTETTRLVGLTESGEPLVKLNMRLARGSLIRFTSDVAGASATIQCTVLLGIFPIALGQDIVT